MSDSFSFKNISGINVHCITKYPFFFSFRHLSDINKDNALNLDEFCIAMHLVVALRHGFELPSTLPDVLLPEKKESAGSVPAGPLEMPQRTLEEDEEREMRNVSSPDVSFQIVNMYCHLNFE